MTTNSWYTIRAAGKKRASIDIDGEIGAWGISSQRFKEDIKSLGDVQNIKVTLNSIGGAVGQGVSIKNALKDHPAKVHIHIDGYALSIASVIATAGDTVTAADDSLLMIHDPWGIAAGSSDDFRKEADVLDKHKDAIVQSYLSRDLDMTEDELRTAMSEETWYTAAEAREVGLVDKVSKTDDANNSATIAYASADLYKYKNAPKSFLECFAKAESSQPKDGSAVANKTEGTEMTKEVEVSAADIEAEVNAAVEANDAKWKALLSHNNASNTEAVMEIAAMNLDAEKSAKMMNLVAAPAASADVEVEEVEAEESPEKKVLSDLAAKFDALLNASEVNAVNKNATADDEKEEKAPTAKENYARYK